MVVGTLVQGLLPSSVHAGNTNVFNVKDSLKEMGLSANGSQIVTFKDKNSLILGTNSSSTTLAIAVFNVDCLDKDPHPAVRLVAYNRAQNKIVAPLVEFIEDNRVLAAENKIIMQSHGVGLSGVEGANLDALITFTHVPCTSSNAPTAPLTVSIQPLGTVKPTGTPSYQAPITTDDGTLLFLTDNSINPVLPVDVAGVATEPSPTCNIDLNTTALSFGSVAVGTNSVRTLIIRNNGTLPCTVNTITRNGSSAFTIGGPATPFSVPANSAVNIPLSFTPVAGTSDSAILRVTSTDPIEPQQFVSLSGNGTTTAPCNINASPLLLNFGSVEIGTNKTLSVTITNSGGASCLVDLLTLVTQSSNFTVSAPTVPFSVNPGTAEVVSVTFTPTVAAISSGTLEIDNDDSNNRLILVNLTATGVAPSCRLAVGPTSLDFGAVIVGTNRTLSVGITNVSLTSCSINSNIFAGSPDFSSPITTPVSLLPGDSTNFVFVYTPTTNTTATGSSQLQVGSPGQSDFIISFQGRGVTVSSNCSLVISRSSISFGDIAVGTADVQKFQISNTSLSNCTIQSLLLSGSSDFTLVSPALPIQLDGPDTVEIGVRYLPGTAGQDIGLLEVITDDLLQPITDIPLDGNGVQVVLQVSTNALNFGSLPVGNQSTLSVFLTNTNTVNCTISSISQSGSGDFIFDPIVPTSQFILTPSSTVEIPVTYLPSNQGSDTGVVNVNGNQVGSPTVIHLNGIGLRSNLSATPGTLTFGKIQLNTTNTLTLTFNNTGNTNGTVDSVEAIGSSRYLVTDPALPFVVAPGQPVSVTVEYLPINIQTIIIIGGSLKSSGNPTIVTP
ncbi:MAG: choice-of-anchor D domain-containing protein [Verrucomicrobiota bacterium]